jgi:hypothetical protein
VLIKRHEKQEHVYLTNECMINPIQAYVNDIILISNSTEELRSLINDADKIFTFLNIKLNPNRSEIFEAAKKNEKIIIGEAEKNSFEMQIIINI